MKRQLQLLAVVAAAFLIAEGARLARTAPRSGPRIDEPVASPAVLAQIPPLHPLRRSNIKP